ncbi:RNA-directed DNA polymerase from mobile element jockey-like, partial [Brachionus plicatilis]
MLEASKLVFSNQFTSLIVVGDFNYPAIKWSDKGFPEIIPFDIDSQIFVDNMHDCFLEQIVERPTFQNMNGETTNILDLVLTSCPFRATDLINKPSLGALEKGHHIL